MTKDLSQLNQQETNSIIQGFEKDLNEIKEIGKDLKGEQRLFFNSIIMRLDNNNHVLTDLCEEHTQLRKKLNDLIEIKRANPCEPDLHKALKHQSHEVHLLKKQIDNLKHNKEIAINRQRELELILHNFQQAAVYKHPEEERIRSLKNKLFKANIKNSETKHLMKLYSAIIYQFDRQQMIWNPIVQKEQHEIELRNRDISALYLINRDSKYSKNVAQTEYYRTENQFTTQKTQRDKVLEKKQRQLMQITNSRYLGTESEVRPARAQPSLGSQPSQLRSKMNKQIREKKEERFRQVSAVYDQIREAFGTNDPAVIQKFFTERRATTVELQKQIEELKSSCTKVEKMIELKKREIEEQEFTTAKGVGATRMLTEGRKILAINKENLAKRQRKIEAFKVNQTEIIKGITHLIEVLQLVTQDDEFVPQNYEEILDWVRRKSKSVQDAFEDEETDYVSFTNKREFINMTKSEVDMKQVDSSKRTQKRILDPLKRTIKDKGDISTRVLDRQAVKLMSIKTVQAAHQNQRRPR
ncbi:hypothetical protein TRFO_15434 [Tritrichomonas foetus]|uniref:Uncharacterized protein n=1 Tax=Tritrichomonas foetus TaxID=1144522 RepID=A0A1J4KXI5_9EUKA|nr:hypothetical protein TRFO_15434 [Tritrichomonas foetus]|eukprot:OHT14269.1 hypothetical protein TRFO_15434 [Tritrichomonas foetus]